MMSYLTKNGTVTDDVQDADDKTETEIQLEHDAMFDDIVAGSPWDENCDGYKQNMFLEFEAIMLQYKQGKIKRDEVAGLMSDSFDKNLLAHCVRFA
jgi:hypothetical protein